MTSLTPPTTLLVGDARTELASLPAACIQTVCTSPPYFGLRDYGSAPQVWDGNQACAHVWALQPRYNPTKHADAASFGKQAHLPEEHSPRTCGVLCGRCKAWCGSLGQEPTVDLYVTHLVSVFQAVRRVLRDDGTCWINLGDSYSHDSKWGGRSGHKNSNSATCDRTHRETGLGEKQLLMVPARVALALQADGWLLRADIIWHKPNAMPESVEDRPTTAHEHIFLLAKQPKYFYDAAAIKEQAGPFHAVGPGSRADNDRDPAHGTRKQDAVGNRTYTGFNARWDANPTTSRNKRSVWAVATAPYPEAHFATWPEALVRPMVLAGTSAHGACAACGAPWRRVVEREFVGERGTDFGSDGQQVHRPGADHTLRAVPSATVGWAPTCRHADATVVPCTVLDPFAGSGTTLAVARSLGRYAVGVELQADYRPLITARLAAVTPWWETVAPVADEDFGPLFREVSA